MKRRISIMGLAVLAAAAAGAIEEKSNVGLAYVPNFPLGRTNEKFDPLYRGAGFKFGHVGPRFGLEIWADVIFEEDGHTQFKGKLGGQVFITPKKAVSPYVNLGFLYHSHKYADAIGAYAGLGARWRINDTWSAILNPNVTAAAPIRENFFLEVPVAVEYNFDFPDWINPANWFGW